VETAIRYLTRRRRFEKEVATHLRAKGFDSTEVDAALERLRELQLVSDEETCRAWVRDRRNFSPRGRGLLRMELLQKGAPEPVVMAVLDELAPLEDEVDAAVETVRRSWTKVQGLSEPVARRRLWGALGRRGFGPETCREAIARFFEENS
jgi:regulatory protein